MYKLRNYSNDVRSVSAKWLFDQIQPLRKLGKISDPTKRTWKTLAGVPNEPGVRLRYLTPNEAARIVLLSLWDEVVKPQLNSRVKSQDFNNALLFNLTFDKWMEIDGGGEASTILRTIYACNSLTGSNIKTACEHVTKKPIPTSTFRDWLATIGKIYRVNHQYTPIEAMEIFSLINVKQTPN